MRWLVVLAAMVAAPAYAQIKVEQAWTRATPPNAKTAAGYMVLRNTGVADQLVGASSAAAERVEMHTTLQEGNVARMREAKAYVIPPRGSFELKPGGAHLMLINPKAPLKEGDKVPVVLRFEKAGEVKAELEVRPLVSSGPHHHHKH